RPVREQPIDHGDFGFESLALGGSLGESQAKEGEGLPADTDGLRIAGEVLVLEDLQVVNQSLLQPGASSAEQPVEVLVGLLEAPAQGLGFRRLENQRES